MKNKRSCRKIVCTLLATVLLCGGGSAAFGVTTGELSPPAPTWEEIQTQSIQQYSSLLDSFGDSHKMNYPDYYAGAYLNEEGKLVIKTTTSSTSARRSIRSATKNENVIFEDAEYSYAELTELKDAIFEYMEDHSTKGRLPIRGCGIDDELNRVIIFIEEMTDEKIAAVKAVVDSPAIQFTSIPKETASFSSDLQPSITLEDFNFFHSSVSSVSRIIPTNLYSGNKINTENTSGTIVGMSVGYRAKRQITATTYEYGFITAGHGTKGNGNVYNTSLEKIGTVTGRIFNAMADMSFVKMDNNVTVYNMIANQTGTVNGGYITPPKDTIIYKSGYAGKVSGGKVVLPSCDDYAPSGVNIRDVIISENTGVKQGDSGGIVYVHNSNGTNTIVGIVSGTYYGSYLATVKASNISAYAACTPNY